MGTHTPGPWEWRRESEASSSGAWLTDHFTIIKPKGGIAGDAIIAQLRCEENARLIAAAPDLLKALSDMVEACKANPTGAVAIQRALVAIAKATGA